MNQFDHELSSRLDGIRKQRLYRELRRVDSPQGTRLTMNGRELLNFASNDYLGLANEPAVRDAAVAAAQCYGAGSGASRLLCGSLAPYHQLEEALADFKGAEAALTFSTGYAAALGTVCALLDRHDVVVIDKLSHACIVDAARLSGASLRVFRHNDLDDLESILKWAANRHKPATGLGRMPAVLVVTESIFSMDGDRAPLKELVAIKERYGAWLMVDEAHATGLYGRHRRGLAEDAGVAGQIEVQMGTLGKALGSSGGYICGSRKLVEFLVNRARSFIFSTAPVPAAAAAATAAIRFVQSELGEVRAAALWERAAELAAALGPRPVPPAQSTSLQRSIFPIIIGDESRAIDVAAGLREQGIYLPAVRYPTVPRGAARLRLTLSAAHSSADVAVVARALNDLHLGTASPDPFFTGSPRVQVSD